MSGNLARLNALKQERRSAFHGKTYRYATSSHGDQVIGVCEVMGGTYAVCWVNESGARKRVKTSRLPVSAYPANLQLLLEIWADQRGLMEKVR